MSTPLRTYYRGDELVGMRDVPGNKSSIFHFDHQGTTQCLTNRATGAVTDRFASDAWGVQVKRTGTSINRQWYVGNLGYTRQPAVELDYIRHRYLHLDIARFGSVDPIGRDRPDFALGSPFAPFHPFRAPSLVHNKSLPWAALLGDVMQVYGYASNAPGRLVDPSGYASELPTPGSPRKRCLVVIVLGRGVPVGYAGSALTALDVRLRGAGWPTKVYQSTKGSGYGPSAWDTKSAYDHIVPDLARWLREHRDECPCLCWVGVSKGGGMLELLTRRLGDVIPQPVGITVDPIKVTPSTFDITPVPVSARLPVGYHAHWHAGKPFLIVLPIRPVVAINLQGVTIPRIAPGFSTKVAQHDHSTIEGMTPKEFGPVLVPAMHSIITARCHA